MDLPVFKTVGEILEYCWARRRIALTYAVIPMGLTVIANLAVWLMGVDLTVIGSPAFYALNIFGALVFMPFTVTWYRMVILGEQTLSQRQLFSFTGLEAKFLFWQVVIVLIVLAVGGGGGFLIGALVEAATAGDAAMAQALASLLMAAWAVAIVSATCRLSLVLAMAATDRPVSLGEAWNRTTGLGLRMGAIFILSFLAAILLMMPLQLIALVLASVFSVVSEGVAESAGVVFGTVAGAVGSLMVLLFPTTLFAFVYNRIAQSMTGTGTATRGEAGGRTGGTSGGFISSLMGAEDTATARGFDGPRGNTPVPDTAHEQTTEEDVAATLTRLYAFMDDKPSDTAEDMRALIDGFFSRFEMPSDATVEDVDAGGVPARWVTVAGADEDRVVLLLHGGGFSAGSLTSHQRLAADLSLACGARVLMADYRLAPEHPFPEGLNDCVTVYRWLLKEGFKPGRIVIAGDSAGGGLAISTALRLKDRGIDQPAALVTLSPWVNLSCDGETYESKAKDDPIATQESLLRAAKDYLDGQDPRDTMISPIYADLRGLPPLLIQVGSREVLLDDSRKLAVRARADDVTVTLEEWPGMFHVWHMMADWVTDGRRAIGGIGTFVRRHMG
ncbi:MAG: alpha/beta hydrolase [Rhodospirillaceae bacterium]